MPTSHHLHPYQSTIARTVLNRGLHDRGLAFTFAGAGTNVFWVNGKLMPWLLTTIECDNVRRNNSTSTRLRFMNLITRHVIRARGMGIS
jgi:hypothetical protein